MMKPDFSFLIRGTAAINAKAAAGLIISTSDHRSLSISLQSLQSQLRDMAKQDKHLGELNQAIDEYAAAARQKDDKRLMSTQTSLANLVGNLPNHVWRTATYDLLSPHDHYLIYLTDVLTALRFILGTRDYALAAGDDDKAFVRTVLGGLTIFLAEADDKKERIVAGMVEEIAAQIQDAAIQGFANKAGVTFPTMPRKRSSGSHTITTPTPVVDQRAEPPTEPVAEPAAKVSAEKPTKSKATPPSKPAAALVPFDYHPLSDQELPYFGRRAEIAIEELHQRIQEDSVEWPYDFTRWARSLYLLTSEVKEIPSQNLAPLMTRGLTLKGLRTNITGGLMRLTKLDTISKTDILNQLAPSAIALGRPPIGLPADWPIDMPNNFAAILVMTWDPKQPDHVDRLRRIVNRMVKMWRLSEGIRAEKNILDELRRAAEILKRAVPQDNEHKFDKVEFRLEKLLPLFPEKLRQKLSEASVKQSSGRNVAKTEDKATSRAPYTYHRYSNKPLKNKTHNRLLRMVGIKIKTTGGDSSYDFLRLARSLYLWAGKMRGREVGKARRKITRGLSGLNELTKITDADIVRLLGPAALAIGHPLEPSSDEEPSS